MFTKITDANLLLNNCFMSFAQAHSVALVQEVYGWGWLSQGTAGHTLGPITLDSLVETGVAQICCSEKCLLALTKTGKVYTCPYTASEGQVTAQINFTP